MSRANDMMTLASQAEDKAAEYAALNAASGLDRMDIDHLISFYRGQASGLRQAAFHLSALEGTNAHD